MGFILAQESKAFYPVEASHHVPRPSLSKSQLKIPGWQLLKDTLAKSLARPWQPPKSFNRANEPSHGLKLDMAEFHGDHKASVTLPGSPGERYLLHLAEIEIKTGGGSGARSYESPSREGTWVGRWEREGGPYLLGSFL
jgi:hypothetical protein